MKILFIIGWKLTTGGHIMSALGFVRELIKRGHEVLLLSPGGPMAKVFEQSGCRNFRLEQLPVSAAAILKAAGRIAAICREEGVDVIHPQDFQGLRPAVFAARLQGRRIIFTKAGGEAPDYLMPPVDEIVVYSRELFDAMAVTPKATARLKLIKGRIDTEFYSPAPAVSGPSGDKFRIFMAMRLDMPKKVWLDNALDGISALASRNQNFVFTLAGDGGCEAYFRQKAAAVNAAHGREVVIMAGAIDDTNEMANQFHDAAVVIGHGRGVLEAMACGTPGIVIGNPSGATTVMPETAGIIADFNFSGRHVRKYPELAHPLTEELAALLDSPGRRAELAAFSRSYVLDEYSLANGARQLEAVYRQCPYTGPWRGRLALTGWMTACLLTKIGRKCGLRIKTGNA